MIEFSVVAFWLSILCGAAVLLTVFTLARMRLLAQRQELEEREELPLLRCVPGSYEFGDIPTKPLNLKSNQKLALVSKVVSAEVLPYIRKYGIILADVARGRRVLVVEDNEVNRDLAIALLGDLEVHVTLALNGRECVDRVAAEPFDLVLMDIQMPLMDGLTAAKVIRADGRFRSLPIVALTGRTLTGDRERSLGAGMNDYLTKPLCQDALADVLIRWMPHRPAPRAPIGSDSTTICIPISDIPGSLPPFDIRAALARANGKPELLRRMMLRFRDLYTHAGPEIRKMIADGKMEEAHRFAHSLKGVAASLETPQLAACAAAIEYALRDGAMLALPALIQTMEAALSPAILAAQSLELLPARIPNNKLRIASSPISSLHSPRQPSAMGDTSELSRSHS